MLISIVDSEVYVRGLNMELKRKKVKESGICQTLTIRRAGAPFLKANQHVMLKPEVQRGHPRPQLVL